MKKALLFICFIATAYMSSAQAKTTFFNEIAISETNAKNVYVLYNSELNQKEFKGSSGFQNRSVQFYEVGFTKSDFSGKLIMGIDLNANEVIFIGTFSKEVVIELEKKPSCIEPPYSMCLRGCNNECHGGVGCLIACTGQCFLNYCVGS